MDSEALLRLRTSSEEADSEEGRPWGSRCTVRLNALNRDRMEEDVLPTRTEKVGSEEDLAPGRRWGIRRTVRGWNIRGSESELMVLGCEEELICALLCSSQHEEGGMGGRGERLEEGRTMGEGYG
jgi:hypothetical protein